MFGVRWHRHARVIRTKPRLRSSLLNHCDTPRSSLRSSHRVLAAGSRVRVASYRACEYDGWGPEQLGASMARHPCGQEGAGRGERRYRDPGGQQGQVRDRQGEQAWLFNMAIFPRCQRNSWPVDVGICCSVTNWIALALLSAQLRRHSYAVRQVYDLGDIISCIACSATSLVQKQPSIFSLRHEVRLCMHCCALRTNTLPACV